MSPTASRSTATEAQDQFCLQCGCCPAELIPGFEGVLLGAGLQTVEEFATATGMVVSSPDAGLTELPGGQVLLSFEDVGTIVCEWPSGLDLTDPAIADLVGSLLEVLGFYFSSEFLFADVTPALELLLTTTVEAETVYQPEPPGTVEAIACDPEAVATRPNGSSVFGQLVTMADVTILHKVTLSFESEAPGGREITFAGMAAHDLDPDQTPLGDLLVETQALALDAGPDAASWADDDLFGSSNAGTIQEDSSLSIDGGGTSLQVVGDVDATDVYLTASRTFSPSIDLSGDFVRLWFWAGSDEDGADLALDLRDEDGGNFTFGFGPVRNGWQQIDFELADAVAFLDPSRVDKITVGLTNLPDGERTWNLDTVRAGSFYAAPARTQQLLD